MKIVTPKSQIVDYKLPNIYGELKLVKSSRGKDRIYFVLSMCRLLQTQSVDLEVSEVLLLDHQEYQVLLEILEVSKRGSLTALAMPCIFALFINETEPHMI